MNEPDLKLINMDTVEVTETDWLWYPYIPYGKITIIQGNPGEGKTTFILAVVSEITIGGELPIDKELVSAMVIYQTAEDGLGDTIKPRLVATGADCTKVVVIDESEKELTLTDKRIEQAIIETKAKLLIIDPLQAFLGSRVDMHRANEIRPIFKELAGVAERTGCAIVLIGHMNKNSGGKSLHRGLGSIDITAAARSVLVIGRINDDPNIRIMAQVKNNLAPEGCSIAFELDEETGFQWLGEYDIDVDHLLSNDISTGKVVKRAERLIEELLADGPLSSSEVYERAKGENISKNTIKKAKKLLKVQAVKTKKEWLWKL